MNLQSSEGNRSSSGGIEVRKDQTAKMGLTFTCSRSLSINEEVSTEHTQSCPNCESMSFVSKKAELLCRDGDDLVEASTSALGSYLLIHV